MQTCGVLADVRDGNAAVGEGKLLRPTVAKVDPGVAPAGRIGANVEQLAHVGESLTVAPVGGVSLAPRVRHVEIGPAVAVDVVGCDPHTRVWVGDAVGARDVDEVEAERATWLVQVEPVRVLVVGHVEIGAAVTVHVDELGSEAVVVRLRVETDCRPDVAEVTGCPR